MFKYVIVKKKEDIMDNNNKLCINSNINTMNAWGNQ